MIEELNKGIEVSKNLLETLPKNNIKNNELLSKKFGFDFKIFDKQPGFETSKKCNLAQKLLMASKSLNQKINCITKHISIEGCIFKSKMKDANIVVVSPTIKNPHSTKERVYIPSIDNTLKLLESYFKSIN